MSAQAQKFKIFEKKLSLGVRSPCSDASSFQQNQQKQQKQIRKSLHHF